MDPVPDAIDDIVSTDEDTPLNIDVLADNGNGADDQGDAPATVIAVTDPLNGTVTINADGTVTYTPDADFTGTDTFDYTIEDANGDTSTATVTVIISDTPDAMNDTVATDEDEPIVIDVLGNDGLGSEPTMITEVTDPANGTVTINADGTVTYTPDPDFNGTDTFEYTITDANGNTSTAAVTVFVDPVPDAIDDIASTDEDTPINIDVLADNGNGADDQGDAPATVIAVTDPLNGTVTINADGTVTYTPDADFNGTDTFDYTIEDANGDTSTATVTVTVATTPDAQNDIVVTDEDTPLNIDVLADNGNGADDQGAGPATVTAVTDPANGTVTINADGTVTYTPDPDFNGTDIFEYTITDANGNTSTAAVTVFVDPVPDAIDDIASTDEDTPLNIDVLADNGNGADDQGDAPATVIAVTDPLNGTVTINADGTVTYTPDADFNGTDTFDYTIEDANGDTSTATVTVTVATAPDAQNDIVVTDEDTPLNIDVLADNGNGADDQGAGPAMVTAVTDPANGTVTINADGTVTYTPDADFNGTDTFEYTITDANGNTSTAVVTIFVDPVPDAIDDIVSTDEDTPLNIDVLADNGNGADDQGDAPATVIAVTDPLNGTVTINADGTVTYIPDADFNGTDTFDYTIEDANGDTSTATVTVTVATTPDAQNDIVVTDEDTPLNIDVLADNGNGADDQGAGPATVTAVTDPANGTVTINADGTVTYTPDPDFNGTDIFEYTITDANGNTSTAAVTVFVDPVPDAIDDIASTDEDTPLNIDVLADNGNGADDQGDAPATVIAVTDPLNGTVTVNADGTVTYTPDADFNGTDTFDYTIEDANGDTSTATVTVVVSDYSRCHGRHRNYGRGRTYERLMSLRNGTVLRFRALDNARNCCD